MPCRTKGVGRKYTLRKCQPPYDANKCKRETDVVGKDGRFYSSVYSSKRRRYVWKLDKKRKLQTKRKSSAPPMPTTETESEEAAKVRANLRECSDELAGLQSTDLEAQSKEDLAQLHGNASKLLEKIDDVKVLQLDSKACLGLRPIKKKLTTDVIRLIEKLEGGSNSAK